MIDYMTCPLDQFRLEFNRLFPTFPARPLKETPKEKRQREAIFAAALERRDEIVADAIARAGVKP